MYIPLMPFYWTVLTSFPRFLPFLFLVIKFLKLDYELVHNLLVLG